MKQSSTAIPVVMYHTVGRPIPEWEWSFLTVPYKIFENHLQWLVKAGYQTVGLYQLHAHVSGEKILPKRSVVLTFDDGYLDNWGYVAPLLAKYGLKGTVFVNPEFVDPRDIIRPTLKDVWSGKIQEKDIPVRGFMSWPELKVLTESGPLSIQSHAMSHTWYPSGRKIIDFHHPGDGIYWLDWNQYPESKPYYLKNLNISRVAWGTPIYEHEKALAVTRFFPSSEEADVLTEYVKERGGENFFTRPEWRKKLQDLAEEFREKRGVLGRFESDNERHERYVFELTESKKFLEAKLGKPMDFLCWPGGGYNLQSKELALNIYSAVTLGSADKRPTKNRVGENARFIRRIGVPCIEVKGSITYPRGRYFIKSLEEYLGSRISRKYRQILKITNSILSFFKDK